MSKAAELLTAMASGEGIEDFEPDSRMEAYLKNCYLACGCDGLPEPITEADELLYALAEKMAGSGSGGGGGGAEKIYETDFIVDENDVDGVICTISTGLTEDVVYVDREIVSVVITCEPTVTPTKTWIKKTHHLLVPNQGGTSINGNYQYVRVETSGKETPISYNNKYGTYLSAVSNDLSTLTVSAWISGNNIAPVGTHHLELYRIGVTM